MRGVSQRLLKSLTSQLQSVIWNKTWCITDRYCSGHGVDPLERLNFAYFAVKLASTRVNNDRVCSIGLLLFRNALEDRRGLVSDGRAADDEEPRRTTDRIFIPNLLPAVYAWILKAGANLILLSEASWNERPPYVGKGGRLFLESEVGRRSPVGFTPWRWMFWLKCLQEIKQEAEAESEKTLEEIVTRAMNNMMAQAKERNSEITRVYKADPDGVQRGTYISCLEDRLGEADS